jgi:hypothetical protein
MRHVLAFAVLSLSALGLQPGVVVAEERPFMATMSGNAHLSPTDDPFILRNDETAVGNATHLGKFAWEDIEYADFGVAPGEVHVTATFTMTAANGDQLYGEFVTVGVLVDPETLVIHGEFRFTGGTGRFADATGGGDIDAIGLLSPGLPVMGVMSGTIDF